MKVQRLPSRDLVVRPWWSTARETGKLSTRPYQVPGSFLRPVAVVTGGLFAQKNSAGYQLEIYVEAERVYNEPFTHQAVLLGAEDPDITLPERLRAAAGWREVLAEYGDQVLPPRRRATPLKEGDRVRAALIGKGGKLENSITIGPVWEPADMVQGLLVVTPVVEKKP